MLLVVLFPMVGLCAMLSAQDTLGEALAPTVNQTLTVDQAVERALARNLSLQGTALDVDTARLNRNTAFRAFYPQISAGAALTFLHGSLQAGDAINNIGSGGPVQNRLSADISAQLVLNFRVISDIQVAILEYEAGKVTYQQAAQEVERAVRSLFYTLLLLEGRISIAEESVRIAEERADDSQIRFDAGLIDEYTLLTAQVNITNVQTPLYVLRRQYRDMVRRFNVLLGNDIDVVLEFSGEIEPEVFSIDADRIVAQLVPISPAINQMELAVDIFRKNRDINAANFLPSITLGYQFSPSFNNDIVNNSGDIGRTANWTIGGGFTLALAVPLSNLLPFSQTWVQQSALERSIRKAQLVLEESGKNIAVQTYAFVESLDQIAQSINAQKLNVRRAQRAFAVAEEGYRVGLRNILEVRDAQNQLDNARLDYLNERFNYITTQIELASQLGIGIDLLPRYALSQNEQ